MSKGLVICGPTATGKTALAIKLAKKFNGEIISADSRQVYKGMDIGTGKDREILQKEKIKAWGLDLVEPDQKFSVSHWLKFIQPVIRDIRKRKKLPIIVGGTGFYIKGLTRGFESLGIPPDWELRRSLSNLEVKELRKRLRELDRERWRAMNKSDRNNPRRLVRAIEVKLQTQKTKRPTTRQNLKIFNILTIGLKASYKTLYQRIDKRVAERVKKGILKEIQGLLKRGYSWKDPGFNTLGYKEFRDFFEKKASLEEAIQRWKYDEHAYARRQMTWFRKQKPIYWFDINKKGWQNEIIEKVKAFLNDG